MIRENSRAGVVSLLAKYRKQEQKLREERERLFRMSSYEREYRDFSYICGIDEVGRGPLAGPVVAAAVILPKDCEILYINDSKRLSEAKREALYDEIMEKAVAVGIGMVGPARIDEINILQATYEAMRQAIGKLSIQPEVLLNDEVTIPGVAKVTRDRLMREYEEILPGYGFASNKGYGSGEHIAALKKLGPTPIHRQSFIGNFVL